MIPPGFREPNVCITKAEAEWLREAVRILRNPDQQVSSVVRRKAAAYVAKIASDAEHAS